MLNNARTQNMRSHELIKHQRWSLCYRPPKGDVPKNASLASTPGWLNMIKIRNEAQRKSLDVGDTNTDTKGLEALFGKNEEKTTPQKRLSKGAMRQMRDSPKVLVLSVPGTQGDAAMDIPTVRPVHPCEGLCVRFTPEIIEHLVSVLKDGLHVDELTCKRAYTKSSAHDPKGIEMAIKRAFESVCTLCMGMPVTPKYVPLGFHQRCINMYIHIHIHTYTHAHIHTYVRTYVHTYIRTYTHTNRQTDIHAYKHLYTETYMPIHTSTYT